MRRLQNVWRASGESVKETLMIPGVWLVAVLMVIGYVNDSVTDLIR